MNLVITTESTGYLVDPTGFHQVSIIYPRNKVKLRIVSRHLCYILQSIPQPRRTYVGYTVDHHHRLRQHNGEIAGGAKATRHGRPWKVIGYVEGFPTNVMALQFEWQMHHHRSRGGVQERLRILQTVLEMDRWKGFVLTWVSLQ